MKKQVVMLAVVLTLVSLWVARGPGLTAWWQMPEVREFGLVTLATIIVASLLALYFDWRGRLMRPTRIDHDARQDFDTAA